MAKHLLAGVFIAGIPLCAGSVAAHPITAKPSEAVKASFDIVETSIVTKGDTATLAVTFHPDFDDGANGKKNRDAWHPHWVVLNEDKACRGGLKVTDIPEGTKPKLPATWPNVPLLIDSPDYPTTLKSDVVEVSIPLSFLGGIAAASYDGVTAGLKINGNLHAPLLCVDNVFKVASGNLSLPGKVIAAK